MLGHPLIRNGGSLLRAQEIVGFDAGCLRMALSVPSGISPE
jgi:hypothetical protein